MVQNSGRLLFGRNDGPDYLLGGPDAGTLYGAGAEGNFYTLGLTSSGVTIMQEASRLLEADGDSVYAGGLVYDSWGAVVNPSIPSSTGTYDNAGPILPFPDLQKVLIRDFPAERWILLPLSSKSPFACSAPLFPEPSRIRNPHPAPLLRVCPRDFVGLCAIPAPTCHYESYGSTKYMILNYLTGEPGGTRTRDPVIKSHMLYQLSYRPSKRGES